MTIRPLLVLASGLCAVALTACGGKPVATSAPQATTTSAPTTSTTSAAVSTPTTTTTMHCSDFLISTYVGQSATHVNDVKAQGWYVTLAGAAAAGLDKLVIKSVDKQEFGCVATFTLAEGDPPPPPAPPEPPPGPLTTVSDGTYLVGTDMVAGSYKSPGSPDGCYWARMKDDGGQNIIANDFTEGQARFTAKKGEFVRVAGCTFTKV